MKIKIYLLGVLLSLGVLMACSDDDKEDPVPGGDNPEESVTPPEKDAILTTLRFDKKVNGEEIEVLEYDANAAEQIGPRPWDVSTVNMSWVGDSIHADTIQLYFSVVGETVKEKAEIFFKVGPIEGQEDQERVANIEVLGPVYLEAGAMGDSVKVVLHYPSEKAYDYVAGIYIDKEKSKVAVIDEGAMFKVTLRYEWEKPATWTESIWGEWSQDKYGFIITVCGMNRNWNSPLTFQVSIRPRLLKWVEKYGHPDFAWPGIW